MKIVQLFLRIFLGILILFFLKDSLYALEIVVSNQPLEKIVKEIAKEHNIYRLQSEKEDFHFFEPTLSQWQRIKSADLVIIVGTESWAKKVYQLRKDKKTLSLSRGEFKFSDPHLWFDIERIKVLVKDFTDYLITKEPSKEKVYQRRKEEFLRSLDKVQKEYQALKRCKLKEIYLLGHPVFGYLLKDSGVREVTLLKSHHKEGEPSIKALTEIYKKAKNSGSKIVFLTDPEFERYRKFFEERGIKVIKLWSGGTYYMPGSYIDLLNYNLENIRKALECK